MPHCYMATDDTRLVPEDRLTRCEMGLPADGFVFCSFVNSYKISPREFDIWMRLLLAVEGSVLWLREANDFCADNLRAEAEARGVDSSRLVFAGHVSLSDHLARHRLADLFLDTFASNAHSTAVDSLWSGLPMVTKLGEGLAARVSGSLLHAIGLSELITDTDEAYEALALGLAGDPDRLGLIKQTLLDNRFKSPLFDTERFTRHLEQGYWTAYEGYFAGNPPKDVCIDD